METCSVDGCGSALKARGLCHTHYEAARRRKEIETRPWRGVPLCSRPGCTEPNEARGLCRNHYRREMTRLRREASPPTLVKSEQMCAFPGCTSARHCRDWCKLHYERNRRLGAPANRGRRFVGSLEDRFWHYTDRQGPNDCWLWTGRLNHGGYGMISLPNSGQTLAHRVSHTINIGPIPAGLDVDHLCYNPACVNPAHLEAVTREENLRRRRPKV